MFLMLQQHKDHGNKRQHQYLQIPIVLIMIKKNNLLHRYRLAVVDKSLWYDKSYEHFHFLGVCVCEILIE